MRPGIQWTGCGTDGAHSTPPIQQRDCPPASTACRASTCTGKDERKGSSEPCLTHSVTSVRLLLLPSLNRLLLTARLALLWGLQAHSSRQASSETAAGRSQCTNCLLVAPTGGSEPPSTTTPAAHLHILPSHTSTHTYSTTGFRLKGLATTLPTQNPPPTYRHTPPDYARTTGHEMQHTAASAAGTANSQQARRWWHLQRQPRLPRPEPLQ